MHDPSPYQVTGPQDWAAILSLLQASFAYMEGRIDPPSSLDRMTVEVIAEHAASNEVWLVGDPPVACMFLTPQAEALYIGKLAVAPGQRHKGVARALIEAAASRARALSLPRLTLQTRIELRENHETFRALGFTEIARTAHPGYATPTSITFSRKV